MDELFIQIRDGQPYQHPIFGGNFREAFPHVDVDNLPPEFARFKRLPCPVISGEFEMDIITYQWINGIVQDVWSVRPMNEEELSNYMNHKTVRVNYHAETLHDMAQAGVTNSSEGPIKDAWVAFKEAMDAWVLVDVNRPNFPKVPVFDLNGQLFSPNLNVPSGAPNVIG